MTFPKRLLALTFLAGALGALGACGRDDPVVSPPSRWDLGTIPSFASVPASLRGGGRCRGCEHRDV